MKDTIFNKKTRQPDEALIFSFVCFFIAYTEKKNKKSINRSAVYVKRANNKSRIISYQYARLNMCVYVL